MVYNCNTMDYILSFLFPRQCPICEDVVIPKGRHCCPECEAKLPFITGSTCFKCGRILEEDEAEYCKRCQTGTHHYSRGFVPFTYSGELRRAMEKLKFDYRKEYADFFADEIIARFGRELSQLELEALVPVPVHSSRLRERGYNQAEEMAKGLSRMLNVPVDTGLIGRVRKTLPQKELDEKERLSNLQNAFGPLLEAEEVKYRRVAIVDDIYTTGSTIEACTLILRELGISEVYFICACIGKCY